VAGPGHTSLDSPSAWVVRWADLVPAGAEVLDVACGNGRHARFFAGRGARVTAADRDAEALAALDAVAGVATVRADFESAPWPFPGRTFDAIVVTNYLHRPLLPLLAAALAPGGLLVYETFMRGNERYGRPSNPAFLLAPGELLAAMPGLAVLGFEQGEVRHPKPAVVQRLCALNGDPTRQVISTATGRPDHGLGPGRFGCRAAPVTGAQRFVRVAAIASQAKRNRRLSSSLNDRFAE
jgi:SAM-dependent methyltransferase